MKKKMLYLGETTDELTHNKWYEVLSEINGGMVVLENDKREYKFYDSDDFNMISEVQKPQHLAKPIFNIDDIINIRYADSDGLPRRIKVVGICRDEENNGGWLYYVKSETIDQILKVNETFIVNRMSNQSAPVYQMEVIQNRLNKGMRWVGNYVEHTARDKVKKLVGSKAVQSAYIREAYDREGNHIPNKMSLWIKHKYSINN